MSKFEQDYMQMLHRIINSGTLDSNRTGVDAIVAFNEQLNIDLTLGFPILTGKKIFFDKAYHEFFWILNGLTTTKYLKEHNIHWWDKFAINGELGKTYGYQLRNYNGEKDQLMMAVNEIKNNSRRAHITMWNPSDLSNQPLPCCYTSFNFVRIGDELNMSMEFRSSDTFLGLPYDIIFSALLLIEVAEFCELKPKMIGLNLSNAHIYSNHMKQVDKYLRSEIYELPTLIKKNLSKPMLANYVCGPYLEAALNE